MASPIERRARLSRGHCPLHDLFLAQESPWKDDDRGEYFLGVCPHPDCHVLVRNRHPDSRRLRARLLYPPRHGFRAELLPEWEYLLHPGGDASGDADSEACRAAKKRYLEEAESDFEEVIRQSRD